MELVCPECGRTYEIPEHTTQRLFKCLCKFTFNLDQGKSEAKTKKVESQKLSANSTPINEPTPTSNFSDDEVDSFASALRKTIASELPKKSVGDVKAPPPIYDMNRTFDIDEEKIIKKPEPKAAIEDELTEESTVEMPDRKGLAKSAAKTPPAFEEPWYEVVLEKIRDDRKIQIGSGVALILFVALSVVAYRHLTYVPPPPPDPYLGKLLSKPAEPLSRPSPPTPAPVEEKVSEIHQKDEMPVATKTVPLEVRKKAAPVDSKPSLYRLLVDGKHEQLAKQISNWKELDNQEKALVAEAGVLTEDESLKQKIIILLGQTKMDGGLASRTQGLIESSSAQTREAGIARLQSLQLTRPKDPLVSAYLGWAWAKAKRPDQAMSSWSQALTTQRNLPWVQQMREETARDNGRLDIAKEAANGLSQINGFEHDGFFRLGRIARIEEKEKEAIAHFKNSMKFKDRPITRLYLGELYIQMDDYTMALKTLQGITKLGPSPTEERNASLLLGRAYCGQKQYKEARASFDRALKIDSNYTKALEARGDCEASSGDHARASKTYERLLKREPQNANLWLKYGRALRVAEKSNPKAALAAIQRSIEIKESDRAHLEMAYALRALGRKAEARNHLKRAIELNPDNLEARRLTSQIQ